MTGGRGGVPYCLITCIFILGHLVCEVKHPRGDAEMKDTDSVSSEPSFLTGHIHHPSCHSCETGAFTAIFKMRKTEMRVLPQI